MRPQSDTHDPSLARFDVEAVGSVTVARCHSASFDSPQVFSAVLQLLESRLLEDARPLVINLGSAPRSSADSIAALLSLRNRLDERRIPIALCHVGDDVRHSLAALHLDLLFQIHTDEAAAVAALTTGGGSAV